MLTNVVITSFLAQSPMNMMKKQMWITTIPQMTSKFTFTTFYLIMFVIRLYIVITQYITLA